MIQKQFVPAGGASFNPVTPQAIVADKQSEPLDIEGIAKSAAVAIDRLQKDAF